VPAAFSLSTALYKGVYDLHLFRYIVYEDGGW